jgi:hypothetical protein
MTLHDAVGDFLRYIQTEQGVRPTIPFLGMATRVTRNWRACRRETRASRRRTKS